MKSCPFCGSAAEVKKAYPDECVGMCFARYYVACTSDECGARIGKGEYRLEDAIEKWNKRS